MDAVYLEVEQQSASGYRACLSIHPVPLKILINANSVTDGSLQENIFFELQSGEQSCKSNFQKSEISDSSVSICYKLICNSSAVADQDNLVKIKFFEKLDGKFVVIGKIKTAEGESLFKADRLHPESSFVSRAESFFKLGVSHIGATLDSWKTAEGDWQLADGIDHILFIVALLLISTTWRRLVINISGFTLGHSLSLALALAKIFIVPARYIEPGIALSIAYVAWRGLTGKKDESLSVTIIFGFLHGMGFSYVLQNLNLVSIAEYFKVLLLFNLGIETGQLLIILLLTPLLIYLLKDKIFSVALRVILSGFIFVLAVYWVVQRSSALLV